MKKLLCFVSLLSLVMLTGEVVSSIAIWEEPTIRLGHAVMGIPKGELEEGWRPGLGVGAKRIVPTSVSSIKRTMGVFFCYYTAKPPVDLDVQVGDFKYTVGTMTYRTVCILTGFVGRQFGETFYFAPDIGVNLFLENIFSGGKPGIDVGIAIGGGMLLPLKGNKYLDISVRYNFTNILYRVIVKAEASDAILVTIGTGF